MLNLFAENQQADPILAKKLAVLLQEEEEEFNDAMVLGGAKRSADDILEAIEIIRLASSYLVSRLGSDKASKAFNFVQDMQENIELTNLDRTFLGKELFEYLKEKAP
jgi:hypothetical protein